MKIYLDDECDAPVAWHRVDTPSKVIGYLNQGLLLSWDHELGAEVSSTGYDVIVWI